MADDASLVGMVQRLGPYRVWVGVALVGLPAATYAVGWGLRRLSRRACARFLAVPVHVAVPPGVAMAMAVAYLLLFARENLLIRYDFVLFFGPIACMGLTLLAVAKLVSFEEVPGFERLSGLMLLSAVSFAVAYAVYQLALRVWFVASFESLVALFALAFASLKLAARRLAGPAAPPESTAP